MTYTYNRKIFHLPRENSHGHGEKMTSSTQRENEAQDQFVDLHTTRCIVLFSILNKNFLQQNKCLCMWKFDKQTLCSLSSRFLSGSFSFIDIDRYFSRFLLDNHSLGLSIKLTRKAFIAFYKYCIVTLIYSQYYFTHPINISYIILYILHKLTCCVLHRITSWDKRLNIKI